MIDIILLVLSNFCTKFQENICMHACIYNQQSFRCHLLTVHRKSTFNAELLITETVLHSFISDDALYSKKTNSKMYNVFWKEKNFKYLFKAAMFKGAHPERSSVVEFKFQKLFTTEL